MILHLYIFIYFEEHTGVLIYYYVLALYILMTVAISLYIWYIYQCKVYYELPYQLELFKAKHED